MQVYLYRLYSGLHGSWVKGEIKEPRSFHFSFFPYYAQEKNVIFLHLVSALSTRNPNHGHYQACGWCSETSCHLCGLVASAAPL